MRVGTSCDILSFLARDKDHPHACGDKYEAQLMRIAERGSSPCVWGQASHPWLAPNVGRIIPMRVGTSYQS